MKVLIYLGHPAQYHFFKNTIKQLIRDKHEVRVLIKTKDILEQLLKEDGVEYTNIQEKFRKNTKWGILRASFHRTRKMCRIAHKFKPDLMIGTDSSIAQSGWLLRTPAITTLEDDVDIIETFAKLTYPFSTDILVPYVCRVGKWKHKKIGYNGYMKLAYLHPNYFTPSEDVIKSYGLTKQFVLIRLAKLVAHHDANIKGLDTSLVDKIINIAEANDFDVYISAETELDERFKKHQLNIKLTDIHHVLSHASLFISDSQSMTMEAAMLGVPNIRFSDFSGRIGVLEELENTYGLTIGIKTDNPQKLIDENVKLLGQKDLKETFRKRKEAMLNDKIDVTAFFVWFIENYPESKKIMTTDPNYQNQFK
jgi:hypothetical protein